MGIRGNPDSTRQPSPSLASRLSSTSNPNPIPPPSPPPPPVSSLAAPPTSSGASSPNSASSPSRSPTSRQLMSSPAWPPQEGQPSAAGATTQNQISKSLANGEVSGQSASVTAPTTLVSPAGPVNNTVTTVAPTHVQGSSTAVTDSTTSVGNSTAPIPHGTANDPLQDPVRAKFVTSPGYVVPAPSFSYSVFPRVNPATGSLQQSFSMPALRLTPPMSAAALQPPVPVNRASFSYNVIPHSNAMSGPGQPFHTSATANQQQMQGGKFAPPNAAFLQPPVPGKSVRANSIVPGTAMQNMQPPVRLPFSVPKGQPSSANFSFSCSSQQGKAEVLDKNASSNSHTVDAAGTETGTSAPLVSSQPMRLPSTASSNTSMSSAPSTFSSSNNLMPMAPSMAGRPALPRTVGTPSPIGAPSSATFSSAVHIQPTAINSSSIVRPVMPSPVLMPSNFVSVPIQAQHNVQQQTFQPYSSVPSMTPPPQPLWLSLPQAGNLTRAPLIPYAGLHPAPFPFPMQGVPPGVPMPNVQPPGVSTIILNEGLAQTSAGSSQSVNSLGSGSPSSKIADKDKQSNDPHENGIAKKEEVDPWTSHKTDSGVIYYYNSITGVSTYEKPSGFNMEPEKVAVQSTPVSWEKLPGTDWTLFTTNDGKKYYYDSKNKVSSWQVPEEVAELRKNQDSDPLKKNPAQVENPIILEEKGSLPTSINAPAVNTGGRESMPLRTTGTPVSSSALDLVKKKLQDAGAPTASSTLPTPTVPPASDINGSRTAEPAAKGQQTTNNKEKSKDANDDGISGSSSDSEDLESGPTKEECIIQFKEMLKERGVAPFSKWDKELPKIVFDPRFKAVPGYSARRTIFEHYVRTRAEEERKEKRAAQKAAIDGFKQLLDEASEDIDYRTDYQTFKRKWGSDPRFEAIDRKERELLLNGRVHLLKKAFDAKAQAIRLASVSKFKSMLQENRDITTSSRWSKVKDSLRNDPRYKSVRHEDRELLFNEYLSELKAAEEEVERVAKAKRDEQEKLKDRERELRKRKEREEQEMERIKVKVRRKESVTSYQALLVETIKDPKASWTESKPKLEKDPQGRAMNPDLTQADMEKLFRDHVKDLYERCAREFRSLLAEVITAEAAARVTDDAKNALNSWSEAKHLLKQDARYAKMPRKEREPTWVRYAEEMMRKQKANSDPKDRMDADGRNRTTSSDPSRSPRRSRQRR